MCFAFQNRNFLITLNWIPSNRMDNLYFLIDVQYLLSPPLNCRLPKKSASPCHPFFRLYDRLRSYQVVTVPAAFSRGSRPPRPSQLAGLPFLGCTSKPFAPNVYHGTGNFLRIQPRGHVQQSTTTGPRRGTWRLSLAYYVALP